MILSVFFIFLLEVKSQMPTFKNDPCDNLQNKITNYEQFYDLLDNQIQDFLKNSFQYHNFGETIMERKLVRAEKELFKHKGSIKVHFGLNNYTEFTNVLLFDVLANYQLIMTTEYSFMDLVKAVNSSEPNEWIATEFMFNDDSWGGEEFINYIFVIANKNANQKFDLFVVEVEGVTLIPDVTMINSYKIGDSGVFEKIGETIVHKPKKIYPSDLKCLYRFFRKITLRTFSSCFGLSFEKK